MENKVLVVDDEKWIREYLSIALPRLGGFRVEVAESAEEALARIDQAPYDLVLTDMIMPSMDGVQLVAEIAKCRPEIMTVLMTGQGTIDSAVEALKHGASDYLTKPINADEMVVRLQRVLEERRRLGRVQDFAAQLERSNEELRKIDEMKSEFISVASHELRTPLTAILNAVQLILRGKAGEINDKQTKLLSMAERSCWRVTHILNNLLDLSKIESGRMGAKLEEFPIQGAIEFTLSSLKLQAGQKSIGLKMLAADTLPPVFADRGMVEQILINLVGNAIKFTPEGGEINVVAELLKENENMVVISVKDSGIGIPEDQREKIFDKFYQVENSLQRSAGGAGLGLAITKGLVEILQGKIWVESEAGKGSTFTFTLPTERGERRDASFRLTMDREFMQAENKQGPLTLFLIEVPTPKNVTKEALWAQLEERVKKCLCRKADLLLKREKEKLLAAFCTTDRNGARVVLRRIKEEIQSFMRSSGDPDMVVNIGVATYPEEIQCKRDLFRLAKKRLKEEKDELEDDTDSG